MNILPFGGITLELEPETGLSRRDYFAGQALLGLVIRCQRDTDATVAEAAWVFADAMIKARG